MEYAREFYIPASEGNARLSENGYSLTREVSGYIQKIRSAWESLSVIALESNRQDTLLVGEEVGFTATVQLGPLEPGDLLVELVQGAITSSGSFHRISRTR